MISEIQDGLGRIIDQKFGQKVDINLVRTDEQFGDFACNVAMQLAGALGKNPREIAEAIADELRALESVKSAEVAGPGFINIRLNDQKIYSGMFWQKPQINQTVLLEYSCPNAFKELHTGHLYQTLIGDSMGRIYEFCGAKVIRTSFGGDVGLHAAKCMWGMLSALGGENPDKLTEVKNRPEFISNAYVAGSKAYEEGYGAKIQINTINKLIYGFISGELETINKHLDPNIAQIYNITRQWSYDYFDEFYKSIGAHPFDKYYKESETMKLGLEIVNGHPDVFTQSGGAVVLHEDKSGLHTRVFITSAGLPTYETKDLGVIKLEADQFSYDKRIIMTGNDQSEYMKVVFKALELINPDLASKQRHVANGTVRFGDGQKMSSRLGNVSRATDVIATVQSQVEATDTNLKKQIALGAVKYSMLKNRVGGDIAFDIDQSISIEGNSGPYLQYALVRARSILAKAGQITDLDDPGKLDTYERRLAFKLSELPEVIDLAIQDFSPHHICTYLYELATIFNQFYENSRVIDDPRSGVRLNLVRHYQQTLVTGLELLGIPTPEKI